MKNTQKRSGKRKSPRIEVINPCSAGIDVGSEEHWVAVAEHLAEESVRSFKCFTADLHAMAKWLTGCGVTTVVMESTGSYWIPVFQVLESHGLDVKLVDAREARNVPGRKSDISDCQWLQQLHSFGLLRAAFRPDDQIATLRALVRHRDKLVESYTPHIQRMQKALTEMNVQLHKVISDITGVTGLRIIKAILEGERDPRTLAKLKDGRIRATKDVIAKSLEGNYRMELLFILEQELSAYEFYLAQIQACDRQINQYMETFEHRVHDAQRLPPRRPGRKPEQGSLREQLFQIAGIDLTQITGLDVLTVQKLLSETGLDMTKWANEDHFASWAGLAPKQSKSARKIWNIRLLGPPRVGNIFKQAAQSVARSQSAMGAFYRRKRAHAGPRIANKATARKLAIQYYLCLKHQREFVDIGPEAYNQKFRDQQLRSLEKRAAHLGYALKQIPDFPSQSQQQPEADTHVVS